MRKIAHNEKDIQKRRATWPEQWTAYQSQVRAINLYKKMIKN